MESENMKGDDDHDDDDDERWSDENGVIAARRFWAEFGVCRLVVWWHFTAELGYAHVIISMKSMIFNIKVHIYKM